MKRAALAVVLAVTGCAGSSSGGETTEPETTPATSHADARLAQRATHYLAVNFEGTSWLPDVKRVRVRGGEMFVRTDLYPDSDADEPAKAICTALRFWPPTPSTVHIVSSTGEWIGC